ncbi:MAG: hypothetical protein V4631_06185 [Pseudomonadota bacterium]
MNTMKKFSTLIVTAALFSLPGMAMAHPEHDDVPPKVQEVDAKAVLTRTKAGATVRVTKDGEAMSTKGATGTLTLLDGEKATELTLQPAGAGVMKAKSKKAIANQARARIMITFADKTTLSTETVAK